MGIYRSSDPTVFDDLDGIVIDETAPPASLQGVATNVVLLLGAFQRGPATPQEISTIGEFREIFGDDNSFAGNKAVKNKKFARLTVRRVIASGAAKASHTFDDGAGGPTNIFTATAKDKGAYGNSIQLKVEAGTNVGVKITVRDVSTGAVFPVEVYDDIDAASYGSQGAVDSAGLFAASNLVDIDWLSVFADPGAVAYTNLSSGSDGSLADSDYTTALAACETTTANIVCLDTYSSTKRTQLLLHAANTQDRMVIIAGAAGDSVATAVTTAASNRDTDGRVIYAYPYVTTVIDSVEVTVSPASWYASLLSQIAPNVDPAYAANAGFLTGITGLDTTLTRANYISLKDAGVSAFEFDSDFGFKVKSGVVTQIADSSKVTVLRRRMADYLTISAARFLKNYQNAPNTKANRLAVKAAILAFVKQLEDLGMLPKDSEVSTGFAKLVDIDSLNNDTNIGAGFFYVIWKQRLYSAMRYIVIKAEIGETVTISTSEA